MCSLCDVCAYLKMSEKQDAGASGGSTSSESTSEGEARDATEEEKKENN